MAMFSARWDEDVLCLSGELDMTHEAEVLDVFAESPGGQEPLVVDMAELTFIDSVLLIGVGSGPGHPREPSGTPSY